MRSPRASGTSRVITKSPTLREHTRSIRLRSRSKANSLTSLASQTRISDRCTISAACKSSRFSTGFHRLCACVYRRKLHIMVSETFLREGAGTFGISVYSRADLLRILHLNPRQLANWERAGVVPSAETYSFSDLLEIKKVRDLCAMSVRPAVIRQSLEAMRKQASGVENPLLESGTLSTAKHRVAFRHEGRLLEPIAGQFLMDFSEREKVLTSTPVRKTEDNPRESEVTS